MVRQGERQLAGHELLRKSGAAAARDVYVPGAGVKRHGVQKVDERPTLLGAELFAETVQYMSGGQAAEAEADVGIAVAGGLDPRRDRFLERRLSFALGVFGGVGAA